ncbi:MAG TPA: hypothetical protein VJV79_25190, partial [Polyangiaceae bacterium]|nr:hypothetical protein [Polyangiaceae bacterium]
MPSFACQSCAKEFAVPDATLAKYPGWQPKLCLSCKKQGPQSSTSKKAPAARARNQRSSGGSREENLSVAEVLAKYTGGPVDGVFTDGAAEPNPGAGGWGAVYVVNNQVVGELWGHEP